MSIKPDGYVAVNPKGKICKYTFSTTKLKCQKKMCDIFCNEEIFRKRLKLKTKRGWRVQAIKFFYLGEMPK